VNSDGGDDTPMRLFSKHRKLKFNPNRRIKMENECPDCSAKLAINQTECSYCGAVRQNADEALLLELMNVLRKYETARARGNKLVMESLLADGYESVEIGYGEEERFDRQKTIEIAGGDKDFLSIGIIGEELLERTSETAKMACALTTISSGTISSEPYFARAKVSFVCREGHWQIAAEHLVITDKNGQEL